MTIETEMICGHMKVNYDFDVMAFNKVNVFVKCVTVSTSI